MRANKGGKFFWLVILVIASSVLLFSCGEQSFAGTPSGIGIGFDGESALNQGRVDNNRANLSVTKQDNPDPVMVGEPLTYEIEVINHGEATARRVRIIDILPVEAAFGPVEIESSCVHTGVNVRCALGDLESGGSRTVTIVVYPNLRSRDIYPTSKIIRNRVRVNLSGPDADNSDNAAEEHTFVTTP
jgi:uncharacterized repeat protein (TIGR01451 family)